MRSSSISKSSSIFEKLCCLLLPKYWGCFLYSKDWSLKIQKNWCHFQKKIKVCSLIFLEKLRLSYICKQLRLSSNFSPTTLWDTWPTCFVIFQVFSLLFQAGEWLEESKIRITGADLGYNKALKTRLRPTWELRKVTVFRE